MLNVLLGTDKDSVKYVSQYFDAVYENSWFNNRLAKDIIKGIDNSEHIKDGYIESPVYGAISPRDLSSGCKGVLLLLNKPELMVCGERFGDNCFRWLFEIAKDRDIKITLSHYLRIDYDFEMRIVNTGVVVHDLRELFGQIEYCSDRGLLCYD